VAVLPEPDEGGDPDQPADLRIDTYRASWRGGQHINKTSGAHHPPAHRHRGGMPGRPSQHGNKAQALKVLTARIHERPLGAAAKDAPCARA
jgi:peptide chain release factor 1